MTPLEPMRGAVRRMHGTDSVHESTVVVVETFKGQTIWDGEVEVFRLLGHPKAKRCYAWVYRDDEGLEQFTAVLEVPPVDSAQTAVRAALVEGFRSEKT